jgi:glucose-6-phosphate isomerase
MTATPAQAWAILKRHARDEMATLRLQDLCNDNDRVSSLVAVHNSEAYQGVSRMLLIDLSRQRMTLETLNYLLRLAVTRGVRKYMTRLAWGQNDPDTPLQALRQPPPPHNHHHHHHRPYTSSRSSSRAREGRYQHYYYSHSKQQQQQQSETKDKVTDQKSNSHENKGNTMSKNNVTATTKKEADPATIFPTVMPSMHLAYRAPKDQGLHMLTLDGVNALTAIHREWDRLERLSDSIRRGAWRGSSGRMIRNVVVVGRGVAIQALKFIHQALQHDETAIMASKFGLEPMASEYWSSGARWMTSMVGGTAPSRRTSNNSHSGSGSSSNSHMNNNTPPRRIYFVSSVDPLAAASVVAELDAASTLVVSVALHGNEETGLATQTLKMWLLQQLGAGASSAAAAAAGTDPISAASTTTGDTRSRADIILSKHMLLVTGNDQIATSINKPESVFVIPEHSRCEGFLNFSSATLLPLSIVFGWPVCEQLLAGGHDMDCHFVETNPRHNLPVLLALTDVWNDVFFKAQGRMVTPFTQAMNAFPAFVAALEAHTLGSGAADTANNSYSNNGNGNNNNNNNNPNQLSCSSLVVDGGCGDNAIYDRALYHSSKIHNTEMVMVMNTQLHANAARSLGATSSAAGAGGDAMMDHIFHHADALVCSLFGQADEMAFGTNNSSSSDDDDDHHQQQQYPNGNKNDHHNNTNHIDSPAAQSASTSSSSSGGNRPSTLLICGTLDAFTCGQLIALSEHRAAIKARIWDIDPFAQESGCFIKSARTEQLRKDLLTIYETGGEDDSDDEDDDDDDNNTEKFGVAMNLSTKTILGHYANITRDQRLQHALRNKS